MNYDKLIETLRQHGVSCVRSHGRYCSICDEAATALSTLQTENERLRAELERVKIEQDAAVSDLEHIMSLGGNMDTCQLCGNAQCHKRGGTKLCLPKWRGQKED